MGLQYILYLLFLINRDVIVLGDINTSHKMIDHCDPCSEVSTSLTKKKSIRALDQLHFLVNYSPTPT